MKKIIKTLLVVMVVVLALTVFVACDNTQTTEPTGCKHDCVQEYLPGYDATCTEDGLRPGFKCPDCGEFTKEQVVVPARGHKWADATCTTPKTCTECDATEGEALGHSFTIEVEAKDAACEEIGYTAHKKCDVCGAPNEDYVEYEALEHNFPEDGYFYYPSAPTCEAGAYIVNVCTICEEMFAFGQEDALGHNVGEDGVCANCGYVFVDTAEELVAALTAGKNVVLTADITMDATLKCPYGNPVGVAQKGGVLDGNGHTLTVNGSGNYYAIITYGGTIKNLKINAGFRAVVTYTPTEDVVLDNVTIVGDSICYGFNTAEHATIEGIDLVVKNSTICGWVSFDGGFESVSFENCNFVQGTYYNNVIGRLVKPYVSTTFTNCTFVTNAYLDLSTLEAGATVVLTGCKVGEVDVTVDVFTTEEDHAEIPFTYEAPEGVELVLAAVEGGVSFHRHNFAIDVAGKDATCTEDGYTAHKACDCGATEGKEEILSSHADANADAKCDVCGNYFLPEVGTAFVLKMYQANLNKVLYFAGSGTDFLNTGDINAAVDMYLEAVDGGYHLYFMNEETKTFVNIYTNSDSKVRLQLATDEATATVWTFDAKYGMFTTAYSNDTYYIGSYNSFETLSVSKTSFVNDDNVDTAQFIARAVVVPEHECEFVGATCTLASLCSICGKEGATREHVDADTNHACDYEDCKAKMGTCADGEDADILCDYGCGKEYPADAVLEDKTYSYTFASGVFSGVASQTKALNGVNWKVDAVSSTSKYSINWDSNNGKGVQFGTSNDYYKSLTLTSESFKNVSKIVINTSGAKSINGSFVVYVGGTQIGSSTKLTTTATDYTFECPSDITGEVKIVFTNSAKAIYIKSITIEYAE